MRKLSNLGVILNKEEQKAISGGRSKCSSNSSCSYGECCERGVCVYRGPYNCR